MPEERRSTMDARVMLSLPGPENRKIKTILLILVLAQIVSPGQSLLYRRAIRLCSRALSDALSLICKDRGFNEPFSYSGEVQFQPPNGPSLVEECCHSSCSYYKLEKYCKPLPMPEKQATSYNTIEEPSFRIVNLPYSSVRELVTAEGSDESDGLAMSTANQPKRKGRGKSRGRGKKKHGYPEKDKKKWKDRDRRRCRCRRRRPNRKSRRGGKVLRGTEIPDAPRFQVGTTSPEPIDSVVLFPLKSYFDFE